MNKVILIFFVAVAASLLFSSSTKDSEMSTEIFVSETLEANALNETENLNRMEYEEEEIIAGKILPVHQLCDYEIECLGNGMYSITFDVIAPSILADFTLGDVVMTLTGNPIIFSWPEDQVEDSIEFYADIFNQNRTKRYCTADGTIQRFCDCDCSLIETNVTFQFGDDNCCLYKADVTNGNADCTLKIYHYDELQVTIGENSSSIILEEACNGTSTDFTFQLIDQDGNVTNCGELVSLSPFCN